MNNQEFLEGFEDAIGISDPDVRATCYDNWKEFERPERETDGYHAGLTAGQWYKTEILGVIDADD